MMPETLGIPNGAAVMAYAEMMATATHFEELAAEPDGLLNTEYGGMFAESLAGVFAHLPAQVTRIESGGHALTRLDVNSAVLEDERETWTPAQVRAFAINQAHQNGLSIIPR